MISNRLVIDYLQDMIDAARKALQFTAGIDFESFQHNDEKIFAVIRAIEVIGEAAKQIPPSIRKQYPHIEWKAIAEMRDKLIHDYAEVRVKQVWLTVRQDLPSLITDVGKILDHIKNHHT